MNCPICPDEHLEVISLYHVSNITVRYLRCKGCKLNFKSTEELAPYSSRRASDNTRLDDRDRKERPVFARA